jgi:FlaA1/EpsC-like NDP-sugar epimerase
MKNFIDDTTTSMLHSDMSILNDIDQLINGQKFLIVGAAGSVGQAVTKEIFDRSPSVLHCVDLSENNLVELVRDIRSSSGYIAGDFRTFPLDCGTVEFDAMVRVHGPYDYILNLSALKHVRSEKDPFTLMRMIEVNILNSLKMAKLAKEFSAKKYFCVSTDKATNPINMMGASKRIMELFLFRESVHQKVSMARFANVTYSDGSLLHGFSQRFNKNQPIVAPNDVSRYFITGKEAGELCLISCLYGGNRDILFPKLNSRLHLRKFFDYAKEFIISKGFIPFECDSEEQARTESVKLIKSGKWPCYFSKTDTTGEKNIEEFFTDKESVFLNRYKNIGVIENKVDDNFDRLTQFEMEIRKLRMYKSWSKEDLLNCFFEILPEFKHIETNKYLDEKM